MELWNCTTQYKTFVDKGLNQKKAIKMVLLLNKKVIVQILELISN